MTRAQLLVLRQELATLQANTNEMLRVVRAKCAEAARSGIETNSPVQCTSEDWDMEACYGIDFLEDTVKDIVTLRNAK